MYDKSLFLSDKGEGPGGFGGWLLAITRPFSPLHRPRLGFSFPVDFSTVRMPSRGWRRDVRGRPSPGREKTSGGGGWVELPGVGFFLALRVSSWCSLCFPFPDPLFVFLTLSTPFSFSASGTV